jgi:hypothetical protein
MTAEPSLPLDLFVAIWNELQGLGTPRLHRDMARWLDERHRLDQRRLLVMAFRGCGKSTLTGLYCAWRLALNPDLRVLVLAADEALAAKMVRNIRRLIERHPLTAGLLPPGARDQWANDRFTVLRRLELRDPSVLARGIEANITGSRADLIICDDVEVPNTAATPEARARLRERLSELDFVLTPGGGQLYLGTPHHRDSLYETGEGGFLSGFHLLKRPVLTPEGRSVWPERFPLSAIAQVKRKAGPLRFAAQMLLEQVTVEAGYLDPARLRRYALELDYREARGKPLLLLGENRMLSASCAWDPAFGQAEEAGESRARRDRSVIACVFSDAAGRYWLHAVRYLTIARDAGIDEANQQCEQVADFLARYHLPSVQVESNGIGRFLPGLLRQCLRRRGIEAAVVESASHKPKDQRILEAFDAVLAAGALHAHERIWQTPLIAELADWRPGITGAGRDDGLDAVAACLAAEPVRFTRPQRPATPERPRPEWQHQQDWTQP